MGRLLSMALDDGDAAVAVFEVDDDLVGSELEMAASGRGTVARARASLTDALAEVRPTLSKVVQTVRELGPDQVEIEFGLKVGGDTSVIIAKGTAEVNFAVRLTWNRS
ncbi:CU044_2847 family protein [Streptomyces sp. 4N509B]|uniref:CU044_2847 family protein n=1 Tax=Streptomyces sp. 4N509B TaxID=3457413 RepID=UPI003FD1F184